MREFSLASQSWYMSHYTCSTTMVSKRVILLGRFYPLFSLFIHILGAFFIKQLFHSHLLDMRLAIANSALRASLAIYHLISNARSWNIC